MSDSATIHPAAARVPVVYFIDDSATMREVIKIAFRKENVQVITCADAATALTQFAEAAPDAVITDVIMPDKDGYEVCDFIKKHEQFGRTPVILMSGVVNKTVAERAMQVKADELIRKPFHPQDLIGRVKGLLGIKFAAANSGGRTPEQPAASQVLSNFFAPPPSAPAAFSADQRPGAAVASRPAAPAYPAPVAVTPPPATRPVPAPLAPAPAPSAEVQKLRYEIRRLEMLVKKLQAELDAATEYSASLEAHVKTLQD
jgi:CheY-like chemotaxis protein